MIINNNYIVSRDYENTRIDKWIKQNINNFPQSYIEKILRKKKIKENNLKVSSSYTLKIKDKINVRLNFELHKNDNKYKYTPTNKDIQNLKKKIIFENDDYLVLSKPNDIAVQSGTKTGKNIIDVLNYQNPKHFIVHRLDKDTSGVLIIAKNRYTAKYLSEQFLLRKIKKKYLALINGKIKQDNGLIKSRITNKNKKILGILKFKTLKKNKLFSLIKIDLVTGRKHQIRKQFKELGHPLVGDKIYSKKENRPLMLHSYEIEFVINKKSVKHKIGIPGYFNNFINSINFETDLKNF